MDSWKRKRMKRNSRGEFITVSFLVKLVLSVIAIVVIIAFGGKIWAAIFPSGDRNTVKSFDSLTSLMNSRLRSNLPYDSSTLSLYIADDHQILLFDTKDNIKCGKKTAYKPTDCYPKQNEIVRNCMCLYDDEPEWTLDEKDENIVKCYKFNTDFKIGAFQLNEGDDCEIPDSAPFFTVIVAEMQNQKSKTLYVWQNTEDMRAVDKELKKPICPQNNPKSPVCTLQKDGTYTTQTYEFDQNTLAVIYKDKTQSEKFDAYDKTFDECTVLKNPTLTAKCNYDPTLKECSIECLNPGTQCASFKKCDDFNERPSALKTGGYIQSDTTNHFLCTGFGRICSPNIPCYQLKSEHYNCIPGEESDCQEFIDGKLSDYKGFNIVKACLITLGPYSDLNRKRGVINPQSVDLFNYGDIIDVQALRVTDQNNQKTYNCLDEVKKYFRQTEVLSCKQGKDCLQFIMTNPEPTEKIKKLKNDCKMKITSHQGSTSQGIIIVYDYDPTQDCKNRISEYFTPLMRCSTDDIKRFVPKPVLP